MTIIKTRDHTSAGFTLIEVAFALMIIGILVASIIQAYNLQVARALDNDTKARVQTIEAALKRFVDREKRYPRPADRDIPMGTAGFGVETALNPIPPAQNCAANPEKACVATGGGTVYIGDVPFATLGLSYKNTFDAYGRKITYAVTAALTSVGTFTDGGGVINPQNYDGGNLYAAAPFAHYFVFSHGPDGQGAYTLQGTLFRACGAAGTNGTDVENCDGDITFRSNFDNNTLAARTTLGKIGRNFATGANQYDDFSGYKVSAKSGLWAMIPGLGELGNNNNGNVIIGTPDFAGCGTAPCVDPPKTKVEVRNGAVRADALRTGRICYNTGSCPLPTGVSRNQLTPSHFAGTPNIAGAADAGAPYGRLGNGILCADGRGLRGFYSGDEACSVSTRAANPASFGNCNTAVTGLYPTGITAAGAVKCN